jgi:hypothetical protein
VNKNNPERVEENKILTEKYNIPYTLVLEANRYQKMDDVTFTL